MRATSDPLYLETIARLRAERERQGLSQTELGSRLGKPQSYVSKVETCERRIDLIETLTLCKALGIGLEVIIPSELQHLLKPSNSGGENGKNSR